jgi:hypothetical protein
MTVTGKERIQHVVYGSVLSQFSAFTAIGGTPSQINYPDVRSGVGLGACSRYDGNGRPLQCRFRVGSIALALIAGDDMTLSDYQESYLTRFAYHATISAATLQSTDGGPTSASLGLKLRLVDLGDSRMNTDLIAKILKETTS